MICDFSFTIYLVMKTSNKNGHVLLLIRTIIRQNEYIAKNNNLEKKVNNKNIE